MENTDKTLNLTSALSLKDNADQNQSFPALDLQLSLSLSTNGQFGVDRAMVVAGESGGQAREADAPGVMSDEEYWRRKEEQTARRLEARKKRSVKRLAAGRVIRKEKKVNKGESTTSSEDGSSDKKVAVRVRVSAGGSRQASSTLTKAAAASVGVKVESRVVLGGGAKGSSTGVGSSSVVAAAQAEVAVTVENVLVLGAGDQQGSIGSSSSSAPAGDAQAQRIEEDAVPATEARSPPRVQPVQVQEPQEPEDGAPAPAPAPAPAQDPPVPVPVPDRNGDRRVTNMPYVRTRYGRRIAGILYRYSVADEMKIVCVCHGHFFTPAEFVLHGGGGDVEHPMRHILVYPFLI